MKVTHHTFWQAGLISLTMFVSSCGSSPTTPLQQENEVTISASFELDASKLPFVVANTSIDILPSAQYPVEYLWNLYTGDSKDGDLIAQVQGISEDSIPKEGYIRGGTYRAPEFDLFSQCGDFLVCLRVRSNEQESAESCLSIENPKINISFMVGDDQDFFAEWISSGDEPIWDWGDGSPVETGTNVSHNYAPNSGLPYQATVSVCAKDIESVDMARENLSGNLPSELFELRNAHTITLRNNEFTGSLPNPLFSETSKLRDFNINENQISGTLPGSLFQNNPDLESINLTGNQLEGSLPESLLEHNPNLQVVSFYNNALTGTLSPLTFANNPSITRILIGLNDLSGSIDPQTFSSNPMLSHLDFSNNNFDGALHESTFVNNTLLEDLDFAGNDLSGSIPSTLFSTNTLLENLEFGFNEFTGVLDEDTFASNPLLEKLNIRFNQLDGLNGKIFDQNPLLLNIDVRFNQFTSQNISQMLYDISQHGTSDGVIETQFQSPSAPPTAAGDASKTELQSRGWTVLTD